MTNQHIHHYHTTITAIWKEENITPSLGEKFKENEAKKLNHRTIF